MFKTPYTLHIAPSINTNQFQKYSSLIFHSYKWVYYQLHTYINYHAILWHFGYHIYYIEIVNNIFYFYALFYERT